MTESESQRLRLKKSDQAWDQVFQLISWWDAERVRSASIMVIGAGALGNEVLKNLALLNVGHLVIVDFDEIEYSNLSRSVLFRPLDAESHRLKAEVAAERLRQINPNTKVSTITGDVTIDVGLGIFRRMDVIIGCLDNRLARLYTNRLSFKVGKTWIDGALENLAGQLKVYKPGTSCYECQLTEVEWQQIRHRLGCPDIANRNQSAGRIATTPISASVIGALQAQEALKVIFENDEQSLAGQTFQYEGMNNLFLVHDGSPWLDECISHSYMDDVITSPFTNQNKTGDFLRWCQENLQTDRVTLVLDHEWIIEIDHQKNDRNYKIGCAKPHLAKRMRDLGEPDIDDFIITNSLDSVDLDGPYLDITLAEFGVPPLHILQVETKEDIHFVELSGDQNMLNFR